MLSRFFLTPQASEFTDFLFWAEYLKIAGGSRDPHEAERWPVLKRPADPFAIHYNTVHVSLHGASGVQPAKLMVGVRFFASGAGF